MKVDRLVSIILMLLEEKRVGAKELAERFEVSPRTIYRDIDAIALAGVPVRAVPGAGGGFEIMPEYKLDKKVFTTDDLSALLMGLSSLSGMLRSDELLHALAKVKSFIPAERARDIELKANQVCIDLDPWTGSGNIKPYLEIIKAAMQERRLLSFAYTDGHGNRSQRLAEPYQLVLKGNHWYVQGFCRDRNDYRLFRLSRMTGLRMLRDTYEPRDYRKPVLDFDKTLEAMQTNITLRVHASILDRVLEHCTEDRVKADGTEHYLVRYPFVERDYYYDLLLGFGARCECLEPARVREELRRRIRALAALYEGPRRARQATDDP